MKYIRHIETEEKVFVILELLRGGEIRYQLTNEQVESPIYTEVQAKQIIYQLLHVLGHLHQNNIVHRDIKPENVVFGRQDDMKSLKLIDFGLAQTIQDDEMLLEQVGSIEYQAPEIFSPRGYNFKVDIFATGVLAYVLLSGYLPWYDPNPLRVRLRISKGDFHFHPDGSWSSISDQAKDLCSRLLTIDPHSRPSADEALSHPWFSGL